MRAQPVQVLDRFTRGFNLWLYLELTFFRPWRWAVSGGCHK